MFRLVFVSLLCSSGLWAQTSNGSILGHVTDTSGGVLANAQITLTDEQRNHVQTRQTDSSGGFLFPSVPIGLYSLSLTAPGFRAYVQQHIKVDVGQSVRIDPVVQVGEVSEKVVVEASAPLLQTASAAVSQVVNSEQIVDLPLNGRDFTQLAILSGDVIRVGTGNLGGARLSVDGGRTQSSHFLLDGANNTETTYDGVRMTPSIDAIQEFRIESNAFSAEYGRSATVINVAIKSGTNALHGTA